MKLQPNLLAQAQKFLIFEKKLSLGVRSLCIGPFNSSNLLIESEKLEFFLLHSTLCDSWRIHNSYTRGFAIFEGIILFFSHLWIKLVQSINDGKVR